MRRTTLLVILGSVLLVSGPAFAALCDWRWEQVTTDIDGKPTTDLAGYRLYVGTERRQELAVSALADPTQPGVQTLCAIGEQWHVTAYDTRGNEGPPSNVVEVAEPVDTIPPGAPKGFRAERMTVTVEFQRK